MPRRAPTDPSLTSWVPGADGSGRPIQHLPLGVFSTDGEGPRVGVAIGDHVLDVAAAAREGLLDGTVAAPVSLFSAASLNPFLAAGVDTWVAVRERLTTLLSPEGPVAGREDLLHAADAVWMHLPIEIADYVDFYSSLHHARNVGRLFRPDGDPLLPNWRHVPVAYHGRAGTVHVSGSPIVRPAGHRPPGEARAAPSFGPSRQLDFELEVGFVTGLPTPRSRVSTDEVREILFGVVLVNDWSARDIQSFEYRPLGPFLGKSFATSIGAWITPLEALLPDLVPQPPQDPPPRPHLTVETDWGLDLDLAVDVTPAGRTRPTTVSETTFADMYWTIPQQLAHTTSNGATVRTGDLYASGTVSGPDPGTEGCLLERTRAGAEPVTLDTGEQRAWLADGDTVTLRGASRRSDAPRIELSPVAGTVRPTPPPGGATP